ncbi:MAG: DNA polymerase III subunit beta [Planctomycetota bacterium]|nr:DNA polymerase III subunit beta [Planctomycetota bacterium]
MKVICDREKLREGLAIANSVVAAKPQKPVLENVCLVATDDRLEIVATDLDVSVRYAIEDVQVEEPGPAVIPARVTLDFVRDLSGETVTLETTEGHCTISSGPDSCELVTLDPDEFPVVSRFEEENTISMQGGSFTRLVQQTAFAAAREPGRYAMHGVLAVLEDDALKLVATDGRRLAVATVAVDGAKAGGEPAIVPTKGMQLFCRVIEDPLDQVRLHFGEQQIGLRTKNAEIFARLIDGEFPRYAAVIPGEVTHSMEADRELFSKKLRLVANVAGDEARAVRLKLEKGRLELFGQSVGRGEAKAHLEVDFKDGEADIAFNPDYVMDGLKHCQEETVRLEFNERTSPGKFRLGENYLYIVMPITVDA